MKTINLNRLQNAEYHALMVDTLAVVGESKIETLNPLKTTMTTLVAKLDTGLMQVRKSEYTKSIIEQDEVRDNYFKGLSLRVQSESFSPEKVVREKAYKLQILLDTYKNLTRENLRKETDLIQNLVKDLQSSDYQTEATAIGLAPWITALKKANDDFATLYNSRRDEAATTENINLKAVRKELDEQYRSLLKTIEALKVLQPSDALGILVTKLNAIITKWNDTLAQRGGKKQNKKKAETPQINPTGQ